MNKEEILKKSREENKNKDLYEKEVSLVATKWGAMFALIITTIFFIVQIFVGKGINYGLYTIVLSANSGTNLYKAMKLGKQRDVIMAILYVIAIVVFSIAYIYDIYLWYSFFMIYMRWMMDKKLVLKNNLKEIRLQKKLSQQQLADIVGVSRNTISSIEINQYTPNAKLALVICIALDKKFEEIFYF